jgi:hypothetical protein
MRAGWAGGLLIAALAGCGPSDTVGWDESPAPADPRQVRVLAPSGRLAPRAWQIQARVEGRHVSTDSFQGPGDDVSIFDWPEEARSLQMFAPGCVPLTLTGPVTPTTLARLTPGPRVQIEVRDIPPRSDDVAGLYVTLVGAPTQAGSISTWTPTSMAATALLEERGFSTAGALVPPDGRLLLHVPVPGRYYASWTVERPNRRSSFQDSKGTQIRVAEGGTDEVVVLQVPAYVASGLR